MSGLSGKVAVVTGGGGGIGRAVCERLARDGAAVAVWDVNGRDARDAADIIGKAGGRAIACETDVASHAAVEHALAQTRSALGAVAILINNAALTGVNAFLDIDDELWDRMVGVNLKGPFLCCKAAIPDMLAAGWGRIVNITSSSALSGTPLMSHYVSSKCGLIGLTRSLAMEFAAQGITVNHIPPGHIDTPTLRRNQAQYPGSAKYETVVNALPMKHAGKPEDVAAACAFLVSEEAGYITGQTISVNGGRYVL